MTISNANLLALVRIERERRRRLAHTPIEQSIWFTDRGVYMNRETGKCYQPHHTEEYDALNSDAPRRLLFKGGEGSGKSVVGIVKDLERLRRGMSGIMGTPDFEHFKRSLWPEFARWCPWQHIIPEQRYRSRDGWEPQRPFSLTFQCPNGRTATLLCGGFDDPGGWEGPNVHFAHGDEMRRHKDARMLKVLEGRCRLVGPGGEPPQWWYTTTPRKHWLYDYFGPWADPDVPDPLANFKSDAQVINLRTEDNEAAGNLAAGYTTKRREGLTEAEARVLLEAEWEDEQDADRFLPSMALWDACREGVPPLTRREPMVIALDAATGREAAASDCFGLVGVTRHPQRRNDVMVRTVALWQAKAGREIDFMGTEQQPGPIRLLRQLCRAYNVYQVCYDPTQLFAVAQQLTSEGVAWFASFSQANERLEADKLLLDAIVQRRAAHDGNPDLRQHIANADRKLDPESRKIRIVKRQDGLKIDLAVCLSMANKRILELNV